MNNHRRITLSCGDTCAFREGKIFIFDNYGQELFRIRTRLPFTRAVVEALYEANCLGYLKGHDEATRGVVKSYASVRLLLKAATDLIGPEPPSENVNPREMSSV